MLDCGWYGGNSWPIAAPLGCGFELGEAAGWLGMSKISVASVRGPYVVCIGLHRGTWVRGHVGLAREREGGGFMVWWVTSIRY